ncbi:MAG: hypothetical protein LBH11_03860 [Propionibacteriaceae bacterium]|jgi:hypothetical protein|nr:hypothetical protein [Propionibacteriaceae bacterium]
MDWGQLWRYVGKVQAITHRSRIAILCDIFGCSVKYSAGYMDYFEYEFFLMPQAARRTYLTIKIAMDMDRRYNAGARREVFDDKIAMHQVFDDLMGREWLNLNTTTSTELEGFAARHPQVIVKPPAGSAGVGIEVLKLPPGTDFAALHGRLVAAGQTLMEPVLRNHPDLDRLYPGSLNTMRVITFARDGEVSVLRVVLKAGNGGATDNFATNGMYTFVDDIGTVFLPAIDREGDIHERHPLTGTAFRGFQVPLFSEALALVRQAALRLPEVPYVGWDVAVTPTNPVIIEGNTSSGIFQPKYSLNPTGIGDFPTYERAMRFCDDGRFDKLPPTLKP